jgi:hypothetical protein
MSEDIRVVIVVLVLVALWLVARFHHRRQCQPDRGATTRERLLKPRTPDDCPACRCHSVRPVPTPPPAVRPWRDLKSRRGAPKRIATEGFACPNRACAYAGITNPQIHALVGDGTHGKHERIQTFRCQACRTTFTSRRDTPL